MKKMFLPLLVPTLLGVSACTPNNDSASQDQSAKKEMPVASNFDSVYNNISDADIREPLKILSSDEFEGVYRRLKAKRKPLNTWLVNLPKRGLNREMAIAFYKK